MDAFSELRDTLKRLQTMKEEVVEESAPLWAKYHALRGKIAKLEAECQDVANEIQAIERPRLIDLNNQISVVARAIGGRHLSDGKGVNGG